MIRILIILSFSFISLSANARCTDELIGPIKYQDDLSVSYILTNQSSNPDWVLIMMPGGTGNLDPYVNEGKLYFNFAGNFLIRSRHLFCDSNFATASTNSTNSLERMEVIIKDINNRFPKAKLCLVGTSSSTLSTINFSQSLDGKIDCFIHTASLNSIARLDTRSYKSRHLLVHHQNDQCRLTTYSSSEHNHRRYKTPLITMNGGTTTGDECQAFSYHGFNGIESETVDQIKSWIKSAN